MVYHFLHLLSMSRNKERRDGKRTACHMSDTILVIQARLQWKWKRLNGDVWLKKKTSVESWYVVNIKPTHMFTETRYINSIYWRRGKNQLNVALWSISRVHTCLLRQDISIQYIEEEEKISWKLVCGQYQGYTCLMSHRPACVWFLSANQVQVEPEASTFNLITLQLVAAAVLWLIFCLIPILLPINSLRSISLSACQELNLGIPKCLPVFNLVLIQD